jgi:hypothetical protein
MEHNPLDSIILSSTRSPVGPQTSIPFPMSLQGGETAKEFYDM